MGRLPFLRVSVRKDLEQNRRGEHRSSSKRRKFPLSGAARQLSPQGGEPRSTAAPLVRLLKGSWHGEAMTERFVPPAALKRMLQSGKEEGRSGYGISPASTKTGEMECSEFHASPKKPTQSPAKRVWVGKEEGRSGYGISPAPTETGEMECSEFLLTS